MEPRTKKDETGIAFLGNTLLSPEILELNTPYKSFCVFSLTSFLLSPRDGNVSPEYKFLQLHR